jgi:Protein of unknown function (DUF3574)
MSRVRRADDLCFPPAKHAGAGEYPVVLKFVIAAATVLTLPFCCVGATQAQLLACGDAQKPQQVVELMFGRKIADRIAVTEDEWARFVDQEITPRFPDGLTVFSAAGHRRDQSSNRMLREPSKVVMIVLPGKAEDLAQVNEIAQAYKTRFKQQSVGVILRPACVSF